ncbi:MAG: hypothetical protein ABFR82_07810 [Nitrospirota bacterium]
MISKTTKVLLITITVMSILAASVWAGNKRIMSTRAAKVLAERALVESVYGLKVRATEEVQDMIAASFIGRTESKTSARISGVKFEEVIYDAQKDIAKVTATVQLANIENIDGQVMDLQNKVFRRVAFATSTPSQAGPLQALRAAEVDAYKQLAKRVVGFTLESQTTVENYILKSDTVKTKVLATMYLAQLTDYGWDDAGDAYVKMSLDIAAISEILGEEIVSDEKVIEVEGAGAQVDDFKKAQAQ